MADPAHCPDPVAGPPGAGPAARRLTVETHGLDVIAGAEHKGTPRTLFWPWFGANVSVLGLSYGAFALGFGISFLQALAAGVLGIVFSFLPTG
jgi:purine-cytosine permease-like protein